MSFGSKNHPSFVVQTLNAPKTMTTGSSISSSSVGFTLTRTQVLPPNNGGYGRFWACAGGTGAPLGAILRLTLFDNQNFLPINTSTWTDPPKDWTMVNENVTYIDTAITQMFNDPTNLVIPQGVNVTSSCHCSLFDFGYSAWLYSNNYYRDIAMDFWQGATPSRPPNNWFVLDNTNSSTNAYDPNNGQDTKGIQTLYEGPTIGNATFGFYSVPGVSNGDSLVTKTRFVRLLENGPLPFVLRAISATTSQTISVYLVDSADVEYMNSTLAGPVADKLIVSFQSTVGTTVQTADAIQFNRGAASGQFLAIVIGNTGATFPSAANYKPNATEPIVFSGAPNYTCQFQDSVLSIGDTVTISLQSCSDVSCMGKTTSVTLSSVDTATAPGSEASTTQKFSAATPSDIRKPSILSLFIMVGLPFLSMLLGTN